MPFYAVSCSSLLSPYLGESERKIRELFQDARTHSTNHKPAIIFIDEIGRDLHCRLVCRFRFENSLSTESFTNGLSKNIKNSFSFKKDPFNLIPVEILSPELGRVTRMKRLAGSNPSCCNNWRVSEQRRNRNPSSSPAPIVRGTWILLLSADFRDESSSICQRRVTRSRF